MKLLRTIARQLKRLWMKFAHVVAVVNTAILLSLFYVLVVGPLWLVIRILRKDYLQTQFNTRPSYWRDRDVARHTLEGAQRQF